MRTPKFIQTAAASVAPTTRRDPRRAARRARQRAPKYFYDRLGSHLFEAITELPSTTRRAPRRRSSNAAAPSSQGGPAAGSR
jgi:uncharacterized SAM-dependent methyltransferase